MQTYFRNIAGLLNAGLLLFAIPVDLHGYWIFRTSPPANKCWQVLNRGYGPLRYWNEDQRAKGSPEDFELFQLSGCEQT